MQGDLLYAERLQVVLAASIYKYSLCVKWVYGIYIKDDLNLWTRKDLWDSN